MKTFLNIVFKFILGFIGTVVVIVLLGLGLSKCAEAQSVPVHEAKPGEIDRSFNYPVQAHGLEPTITPFEVYDDSSVSYTVLRKQQCDKTNKHNYALVQMIAKEIAVNPELGYMWVGALTTIHSLWCTSYD